MAHHVFISYASKNKQLADALCHTLEQHRISCWIAPRDVLPGEPYAREIIRGIRDCQIIVLIYTNDSNASEHVLNEIDKELARRDSWQGKRLGSMPAGGAAPG